MPQYLKAKTGTGGSLRNQIKNEAVSATNKDGRAFNTTIRQAYINTANLFSNMNFEGTREYPQGTIMAGSPQSAAGE